MEVCSIILSAGKGSRMLSSIPKPLNLISGKTMLQWVIDANKAAGIKKSIIVVSKEFDGVGITNQKLHTVIQEKRMGTGDATRKATTLLKNFEGAVLICFADTPFISFKTLKKMVRSLKNGSKLVLTGFEKNEKNKYGKIIFDNKKKPYEILEYKDTIRKPVNSNLSFHTGLIINKVHSNDSN